MIDKRVCHKCHMERFGFIPKRYLEWNISKNMVWCVVEKSIVELYKPVPKGCKRKFEQAVSEGMRNAK